MSAVPPGGRHDVTWTPLLGESTGAMGGTKVHDGALASASASPRADRRARGLPRRSGSVLAGAAWRSPGDTPPSCGRDRAPDGAWRDRRQGGEHDCPDRYWCRMPPPSASPSPLRPTAAHCTGYAGSGWTTRPSRSVWTLRPPCGLRPCVLTWSRLPVWQLCSPRRRAPTSCSATRGRRQDEAC
jgi:hypothetical protein